MPKRGLHGTSGRAPPMTHGRQAIFGRRNFKGNQKSAVTQSRAGEHDLLSVIIADLGKENLECASLVLTSRPHMAAVNGERNRFRCDCRLGAYPCDGFPLQPGASLHHRLNGIALPLFEQAASHIQLTARHHLVRRI
jgi:hypothetical protein